MYWIMGSAKKLFKYKRSIEMRRNRLIASLVSLMMIFVIAGCSNSADTGSNTAAANGNKGTANGKINGFGQPDVYGEVSKIDGNKVTLKLLQIPTMGNRNGQNRGNGQNADSGQNTNNGQNQGNFQNGNGGRGAWRGNGGPGGMRAKQYTGKEQTITIPDGTTIVTFTRGQNGMEENTISMKDITVGSTLSLYYKEDGKTIDKIRVMQPFAGPGQDNNQNNTQNNGQNGQGNSQNNGQSSNSSI
jgi:hypothetical protein